MIDLKDLEQLTYAVEYMKSPNFVEEIILYYDKKKLLHANWHKGYKQVEMNKLVILQSSPWWHVVVCLAQYPIIKIKRYRR